jgi:hypothetical protein
LDARCFCFPEEAVLVLPAEAAVLGRPEEAAVLVHREEAVELECLEAVARTASVLNHPVFDFLKI